MSNPADVLHAAPRNAGWCACCRRETEFVETGPWLRDQYLCAACGSIPRFRALMVVLDACVPDWRDASIHECSPAHHFVQRACARYSCSALLDGVPPGGIHEGLRCEDVERLTFDDETFDLVITQDVLEHVFLPGRAVREIVRVLKPGGAHVFTTPKHPGLRRTRQRARLDGGQVTHLLEPQYHGSPVGDGRALVTWDYGDDFERLLWTWCHQPTVTYVTRDRTLGLDGEYLDVFVTRKLAIDPTD